MKRVLNLNKMIDCLLDWENGTILDLMDLVPIAIKAWKLNQDQSNQLVNELDKRGLI